MRRAVWIGIGVVGGIYLARRVGPALDSLLPPLPSGGGSIGDRVAAFADAVRDGMAEREHELRVALGTESGTLERDRLQGVIEDPTGAGAHRRRPGDDASSAF